MAGTPFPQGTELPGAATSLGRCIRAIDGRYFIHATRDGRRALLAAVGEADGDFPDDVPRMTLEHRGTRYGYLVTSGTLDQLEHIAQPESRCQAMPFATLLRTLDEVSRRAIYCSDPPLLLDIASGAKEEKAVALGRFLTGGAPVRADDVVQLRRVVPGVSEDELVEIAGAAGIPVKVTASPSHRNDAKSGLAQPWPTPGPFSLPGREDLARFFKEHVIEIVEDVERYSALGIDFPGGIVLEGPTGCGKTFAVERLIEHLGWPSFHIEASSVASPYIHETSRKVAEIFAEATKQAPSVIVVDEMDAFLSSRDGMGGQHHLEEVAEFLRRIPEASKGRVLVIGMTNKVDMIDPAILRRGRFDHIIHVGQAGTAEVKALLSTLFAALPNDIDDLDAIAGRLAGRPLSDVSFVVREAGRIAARARRDRIGNGDVSAALALVPSRDPDKARRIGF